MNITYLETKILMQFNLIKLISLTLLLITEIFFNCAIADISLGNDNWKIFTNRSSVLAIDASKDGKILWIGTVGGLEQRTADGQLVQVFTTLDGLPDNFIFALASDTAGGLWVGTEKGGLAYRSDDGNWQIFNTDNSDLPDNKVLTIIVDDEGGLWIGTKNGLAHLSSSFKWQIFNTENSELPHNHVKTVATDGNGGLWTGGVGIAHLDNNGKWQIFNSANSDLPHNGINTLISDGEGGIWVGTYDQTEDGKIEDGGLTHLNSSGKGQTFNTNNSDLPHDMVRAISSDNKNGLWLGTDGGFAHSNGKWEVFNENNSGLPHNTVYTLFVDAEGGQWLGTDNGLAHFKNNKWQTFNDSSELPDNIVQAIANDANGGLWVGTRYAGMAHRDAFGEWQIFNTDNSDLPNKDVNALLIDGNGGVWVGTYGGGLAQLRGSGKWKIFNELNSELPNNKINAIVNDGTGGIWVATDDGGLAHLNSSSKWKIFDTNNSDLPDNDVNILINDGNGGLWLGTNAGLAHFDSKSKWKIFNFDNSDLPVNTVLALTLDHDGIWVGTHKGGLTHFDGDSNWKKFNTSNSGLPDDTIIGLVNDSLDGLWVGTLRGGIAHLSDANKWTIFNTNNSGLPTNVLLTLMSDDNSGLWVGMNWGGLAHLTFGQKSTICTHINEADCKDVTTAKRAAILIHPKGASSDNQEQELAVDFMATYAYHSLQARGYDNDEIYFLSYRPDLDFNADAQADFSIVDAPVTLAELRRDDTNKPRDITVDDIEKAFEWAKDKGKLGQPLIVIFVDHGLPNELLLDPLGNETLTAETFKTLLDDYQNSTNNQVVVILEACHSGTLVPTLAAPNRLIISSTDAELAYFNDRGRISFLKLFFDNLRQGKKFGDSLKQVTDVIATYSRPLNQQSPQLNDNTMAQNLCLNGCWGGLPNRLVLRAERLPNRINLGQPIDLTIYTNNSGVGVKKVWASVITPQIASQRNKQGYSLQPAPFIPFTLRSTNTRKNEEEWQGGFSELTLPGDYMVTFRAEDNKGFITDAPSIILTVEGEGLTHARFDATTNIVHIPAVTVGTDIYQADLLVRQVEPSIILEVDMNSLRLADDTTAVGYSNFTPSTGEVYIPLLEVPNATGGIDTYSVNLQLEEPQASPLQFKVKAMVSLNEK